MGGGQKEWEYIGEENQSIILLKQDKWVKWRREMRVLEEEKISSKYSKEKKKKCGRRHSSKKKNKIKRFLCAQRT